VITLDWDDADQTIFLQRFIGSWTWAELFDTWDKTYQIMEDVPYDVDFILDFTEGAVLPNHFFSNLRVASLLNAEARVGIRVVVGVSPMLERFWDVFSQAYESAAETFNFEVAGTLDDARAAIAAYRVKHPRRVLPTDDSADAPATSATTDP
jgi:hypothetical protein